MNGRSNGRNPDVAHLLGRIARSLDMPVEGLLGSDHRTGARCGPSGAEADALLAVFMTLTNPQARRRVVNAALAEASRAGLDPRG